MQHTQVQVAVALAAPHVLHALARHKDALKALADNMFAC